MTRHPTDRARRGSDSAGTFWARETPAVMKLAFGDCVFDSDLRQLVRGGVAVHLTPKALRLLELLLERRPKPISKQEIRDVVWPDTVVAEGSLANVVFEVRNALGDDPREPRFVRTVHSF